MALVGHDDLQARSAYQPTIQPGERGIAYIGHHGGSRRNPLTGKDEQNGTSIVDVTDLKKPHIFAYIPGEAGEGENGGAQMVRLQRKHVAASGQEQGVSAAIVRQLRSRDLGGDGSGEADSGRCAVDGLNTHKTSGTTRHRTCHLGTGRTGAPAG